MTQHYKFHCDINILNAYFICRAEDAKLFAKKMIGETLVTKQTGERGIEVAKVFIDLNIFDKLQH